MTSPAFIYANPVKQEIKKIQRPNIFTRLYFRDYKKLLPHCFESEVTVFAVKFFNKINDYAYLTRTERNTMKFFTKEELGTDSVNYCDPVNIDEVIPLFNYFSWQDHFDRNLRPKILGKIFIKPNWCYFKSTSDCIDF